MVPLRSFFGRTLSLTAPAGVQRMREVTLRRSWEHGNPPFVNNQHV
jgi:hypothetical protein